MSRAQCFLVEDDIDDQDIFQMALRLADPQVSCFVASNGVEALSWLDSKTEPDPEFIFIDINMPLMNGIEFLSALRKSGRCQGSKVYFYSTSVNSPVVEAAKELAVTELIKKPDNIQELVGILKKIVADNTRAKQ